MKNKKILLIIGLLVLFIINTILVVTNAYVAFDDMIHHAFMQISSETTTNFMKVITFFGSTLWIILLCAILFAIFLIKKRRKEAFSTAGILIGSTLINTIIKVIVRRTRPVYMIVSETSFSYPSGHMMASTTLYGFIIYLLIKSNIVKKYKIIFSICLTLLIVLVGMSRIYLGAHFFSDVFGSAILSTSLILITDHLLSKISKKKETKK